MMKTFEPFRQLKDGIWRDYALISTKYTRFEVVDLEKGEIIATQPYPTYSQEQYDRAIANNWKPTAQVGEEMPGWGFCPVEFRVFDWREHYTDESMSKVYEHPTTKEKKYLYDEKDFYSLTGQWAIYSGCIWGDDSGGWKVRYIDLSRISEGIVTADERFGYIQLASKGLNEVEYWTDDDRLVFPVELYTNRETGKSYSIDAHWEDE